MQGKAARSARLALARRESGAEESNGWQMGVVVLACGLLPPATEVSCCNYLAFKAFKAGTGY